MRPVPSRRHSHPPATARLSAATFTSMGAIAALASDSSSSSSSYSLVEAVDAPAPIIRPSPWPPQSSLLAHSSVRRRRTTPSALTKANLVSHTKCHATRDDRRRHVEAFVDAQAEIVCIEASLQRALWEEVRTMIPLDTPSPYDSVIQDDPWPPHRLFNDHPPHPQPGQSQPDGDDASSHAPGHDYRQSWPSRLFSDTRRKIMKKEQDESRTFAPRPVSSSLFSSDAMETVHQKYELDKSNLIQHGLCGLSNVNIARALAGTDYSLASIMFTPDTMLPASAPTPVAVSPSPSSAAVKRDSGISFFASKSIRGLSRRRHSKASETAKEFSAVRYPKMVRLHALREFAIQVLTRQLGQSSCLCHSEQAPMDVRPRPRAHTQPA